MLSVFKFDAKARLKAIQAEGAAKPANVAKNDDIQTENFSNFSSISEPHSEPSAFVSPSNDAILNKVQDAQPPEKPPELNQEQVGWQKKVGSIINKMKPENRTKFIRRTAPGID